jgi:hypothetical protein
MTSEKLTISQQAEKGNALLVENVTVVLNMEKTFYEYDRSSSSGMLY